MKILMSAQSIPATPVNPRYVKHTIHVRMFALDLPLQSRIDLVPLQSYRPRHAIRHQNRMFCGCVLHA